MRSLIVVLTVFCFGISSVHAEHFDKRFKPGYELLEQGQYDQALETFEQLKTDNPDSELIDYSIASVFYKKALALKDKENTVELNTQDPAAQAEGVNKQQSAVIGEFANAKKQFEAISNSSNDFLRENAPLNAANCSSQIAKIYHPEHQYKERVGALVQALSEYDTYIGQFPDQDSAQRNRDHVSYLLKQLLRNPPEEEEQQEGEDDNSEEDKDQQNQDKEDSGEEEEPGENEDEQEGSVCLKRK